MIDYSESCDTPLSMTQSAAPGRLSFVGAGARLGMALIFDQAVVSATNFATTLIIARLCTKADVGVYYLAWTLVLFIVARKGTSSRSPIRYTAAAVKDRRWLLMREACSYINFLLRPWQCSASWE